MKKKVDDFNAKVIWSVIIAAVIIILDSFLLSNLGQPVLPEHRRETFTQMFTGSVLDWIGLVGFNAVTLFAAFGIWGGWTLSEEENSARWGKVWAIILAVCLSLIAIG